MNYINSYGQRVFNDLVMRNMLDEKTYESLRQTRKVGNVLEPDVAQKVADAMLSWAVSLGATHYIHWFQPMTDTAAGKSEGFLMPGEDGTALLEFSSKELIQGEPDASSFPSGGLRNTFEARGYTAWDPTSSVFIKDDILYIPTCFCGPSGESLDYKTPLLRSMDAISSSAVKLLRALGDNDTQRVTPQVGAEQEYFLLDRELYEKRLDLKICGRTLVGAPPPKSQELDDHYYGRVRIRVAAFMKELDEELWKFGIPAKTKHNEVAPTQHELAVTYDTASLTCDSNQLIMEVMRTVAKRHSLACLLHEKPFAGVNGSGKHNNYSLTTDLGSNLLSPGKQPETNITFLIMMGAYVRALDKNAPLLRLTTATPNNDFRLGGYEAPPPIISMFFGDDFTSLLKNCTLEDSLSEKELITTGVKANPQMLSDDADRNRTSPFAFTGNKFEFRMVGSSQSIGLVNTVLNTILAESFDYISEQLKGVDDIEQKAREIVRSIMAKHGRIIFNGDNYSQQWREEAQRRGLPIIEDALEAIKNWNEPSTVYLFEKYAVLSKRECASRYEIMMENYRKIIVIEASTLLEMMKRQIIPAVIAHAGENAKSLKNIMAVGIQNDVLLKHVRKLSAAVSELVSCTENLRDHLQKIPKSCIEEENTYIRNVIRDDMLTLRRVSDEVEKVMDYRAWPMPTYTDLMHRV